MKIHYKFAEVQPQQYYIRHNLYENLQAFQPGQRRADVQQLHSPAGLVHEDSDLERFRYIQLNKIAYH